MAQTRTTLVWFYRVDAIELGLRELSTWWRSRTANPRDWHPARLSPRKTVTPQDCHPARLCVVPVLWYEHRMSVRRITVSLPEETARRLKKAARGRSVSALLTELVDATLDTREIEAQWLRLYDEVAPPAAAERKAERLFAILLGSAKPSRQSKKRAA
jgi:hypothetical protein